MQYIFNTGRKCLIIQRKTDYKTIYIQFHSVLCFPVPHSSVFAIKLFHSCYYYLLTLSFDSVPFPFSRLYPFYCCLGAVEVVTFSKHRSANMTVFSLQLFGEKIKSNFVKQILKDNFMGFPLVRYSFYISLTLRRVFAKKPF